jgi:hypothetical protein
MHTFSFSQILALGLLASAPLASAYVDVTGSGSEELTNKRFVVSHALFARRRKLYSDDDREVTSLVFGQSYRSSLGITPRPKCTLVSSSLQPDFD